MESDAVGLAPLQVLLHAAGLLHEGLEVIEPGVHTTHHCVKLRDGDHVSHLHGQYKIQGWFLLEQPELS